MSDSMRDEKPVRHPCVVAFDKFKAARADMFDGSAQGVYLANRLSMAHYEGWLAAERAVKAALEGR